MVVPFLNGPEKEINLDFCRKRGIPVRRLIVGGAIFGDPGYVITFLHIKINDPRIPPNAEKLFEKTLTQIGNGISQFFNVECRFRSINDIEIKCDDNIWRKIGSSACSYKEKAAQMSSGIQVKGNDAELISSIIVTPKEKFEDKQTKSIQERITYLGKIVSRIIDLDEVKQIYIDQIERLFAIKLIPGGLTEKEKIYYQEMEKEYTSNDFFMERSEKKFGKIPSGVVRRTVQFKVPGGPFVRIIALTTGSTIWDMLITGTIHASP